MINNYLKVGTPVVRPSPKTPGSEDTQHVVFFDEGDVQQVVEVNRVTRGRVRSIFRPMARGPLVDVHEIGTKQEEV